VPIPTLFYAAGHGGKDAGNTSAGYNERDELIRIAGHIAEWYRLLGIPPGLGGAVKLDDRYDVKGEVKQLKKWQLTPHQDLAVDLHLDYRDGKGGALMLVDDTLEAQTWAQYVHPRWCKATGIKDNGIHNAQHWAQTQRGFPDFHFTAQDWPGVIWELGCMTCAADMDCLKEHHFCLLAGQLMWDGWRFVRSKFNF
jgi:N-acetylmuramoyl-L-alanine amidase